MSWMRFGIPMILLTSGAVAPVSAFSQEPPAIRVDVSVVNLLATVRDPAGRIVNDLAKDDFVLDENGERQEIRYFSRQTDLPLTIGLLVDTSMSQRRLIDDERKASYQFFEQVLRPDRDQAFVIKFDVEVVLLQDLTSSRGLLRTALDTLGVPASIRPPTNGRGRPYRMISSFGQTWPGGMPTPGGQRGPGGGRQGSPGPGGPRMRGIGTALFDSVFLAADEVLRPREGRKVIVLISDGVDNGSRVRAKDAIEAALRADTLIYCVRYFDLAAYTSLSGKRATDRDHASQGMAALAALSKETGGRTFEVTKDQTLEEIFDVIQEEVRNQYSLGYTPPAPGDAGFRRISLRTTDDRLKVLTRTGYYHR